MLVSFTQTYGNNREILHKFYSKDNYLKEFKSHFDINFHSFHNCSQKTIDYYKSINIVKNTEYLIFNNKSYGECILQLKNILKDIGCTHFFFSQDDTFSANEREPYYNKIIEYIKEQSNNFTLVLQYPYNGGFRNSGLKPIKIKDCFYIYKSDTLTFNKYEGGWSVCDNPYIATIDMVFDMYDDTYTSIDNIWDCEIYLSNKYKNKNIPRYFVDHSLFMNYNLIGPYAKKENELKNKLKLRGIC
jgi:hypothetical protein